MNNVRYITATHIGTWAQDKISRFTLLPQNDEPILWDFGSAARHHQLNCPWLGERSRAGIPLMRGAMSPGDGARRGRGEEDSDRAREARAAQGAGRRSTSSSLPVLFALQKEGLTIVDGQQLMSDAREIKTQDEISLLNHSAMMVDAAYHELYMAMKPGMRENEAVGLVAQGALRSRLRIRRGRQRDLGRALQPAPARLLRSRAAARRSGVLRRPPFLHGLPHLLLPDVRDRLGVARAE